jgi:hypothetical protein
VAWLGRKSEDSTLAVATIQDIADCVRWHEVNRHLIAHPYILATLLKDDRQVMMAWQMNWVTIKSLFEREWLDRLWII